MDATQNKPQSVYSLYPQQTATRCASRAAESTTRDLRLRLSSSPEGDGCARASFLPDPRFLAPVTDHGIPRLPDWAVCLQQAPVHRRSYHLGPSAHNVTHVKLLTPPSLCGIPGPVLTDQGPKAIWKPRMSSSRNEKGGGRGEGRLLKKLGVGGRKDLQPLTDWASWGRGRCLLLPPSALHRNERQMKAEGDRPGTCSSGETRQTGILSHSIKRKGCTVIPLEQEGGAGSGATYPRSALTSRLSNSFTLSLSLSQP